MSNTSANGLVSIPSNFSVDQTVARLKRILDANGIRLFAVVNHSEEAAKIGLDMPPTSLLIFGSPKAGTPLMLASPSSAIDLPLKILVSEEKQAEGRQAKVWITYNAIEYLRERHHLPDDLMPNIAAIEVLATQAAE